MRCAGLDDARLANGGPNGPLQHLSTEVMSPDFRGSRVLRPVGGEDSALGSPPQGPPDNQLNCLHDHVLLGLVAVAVTDTDKIFSVLVGKSFCTGLDRQQLLGGFHG